MMSSKKEKNIHLKYLYVRDLYNNRVFKEEYQKQIEGISRIPNLETPNPYSVSSQKLIEL